MRKQRIDLIGANEPAPHALFRRQRRDVGVVEQDTAGVRPQHAGHQIDQRRLAGAVRADQRVAHPGRAESISMSAATTSEPKLLLSPRVASAGVAHDRPPARRSAATSPPRMPFGNNMTTATSRRPIQKYQYCGLRPENWSRATMIDRGADQAAIEPAGAAEDQHHQHVGRALKAQRLRATRFRVVCASNAPAMPAMVAAMRVDGADMGVRRRADRRHARRDSRECRAAPGRTANE